MDAQAAFGRAPLRIRKTKTLIITCVTIAWQFTISDTAYFDNSNIAWNSIPNSMARGGLDNHLFERQNPHEDMDNSMMPEIQEKQVQSSAGADLCSMRHSTGHKGMKTVLQRRSIDCH
jgi:hypothetical protein